MLRAALLLTTFGLAACGAPNSTAPRFDVPTLSPPRPGDPRTNAAVTQTCREQSARELQRQDRGQLLREDESSARQGAGFGGLPATSQSDVLGRQFLLDRRISECIRANTREEPAAQPAAAPSGGTPTSAPAARSNRTSRPRA